MGYDTEMHGDATKKHGENIKMHGHTLKCHEMKGNKLSVLCVILCETLW